MVKFISRLGNLFGKDPKKAAKNRADPDAGSSKSKTVHVARHKKAAKPKIPAKSVKPAAVKAVKVKTQVRPAIVVSKPAREQLKSVVLFVTPDCPGCADARKLVYLVRRVVHNVALREVDISTRDGELEGLLSGVVKAPAFAINGRLVFRGVLPSREQLARVINEAPVQ